MSRKIIGLGFAVYLDNLVKNNAFPKNSLENWNKVITFVE